MVLEGAIYWGEGGPRPLAPSFDFPTRRDALYDWMRQVRGGVLAGACVVERHISAAIVHFILGDRINISEVQSAFDEGLLAPMTFERRINLILLIAPSLLAADEVTVLKAELGELRRLRNAMAHRPFWFTPSLNEDGEVVELVPMIMGGKKPLPITTSLVKRVNTLISGLIDRTEHLARVIAANPPTTPVLPFDPRSKENSS